MAALIKRTGNCYLISSTSLAQSFESESYEPQQLISNHGARPLSDGRAPVWVFPILSRPQSGTDSAPDAGNSAGNSAGVLRHYYRGGLIAKVSADRFVWCGINRSRAVLEYRLLEWMYKQNLPVPEPLGARVLKQGAFYTCDIITRYLPDTVTLATVLSQRQLQQQHWFETGQVIRQLHNHGVWHSDLNANNILLDNQGTISLIDFDRCRRRNGTQWQQSNIARLRRSIDKLKHLEKISYFNETDWQSLLDGYNG